MDTERFLKEININKKTPAFIQKDVSRYYHNLQNGLKSMLADKILSKEDTIDILLEKLSVIKDVIDNVTKEDK